MVEEGMLVFAMINTSNPRRAEGRVQHGTGDRDELWYFYALSSRRLSCRLMHDSLQQAL
jgi:hypothetical protein